MCWSMEAEGEVVISGSNDTIGPVARILAMDKVTGIANIAEAMSDGYSTAGTMGGGLGAMKRMATRLEIFTGRTGTIVLLELGKHDSQGNAASCRHRGALSRASASAATAGIAIHTPDRTLALIVDGLGHGWGAAEAAQEAIATFRQRVRSWPRARFWATSTTRCERRGAPSPRLRRFGQRNRF